MLAPSMVAQAAVASSPSSALRMLTDAERANVDTAFARMADDTAYWAQTQDSPVLVGFSSPNSNVTIRFDTFTNQMVVQTWNGNVWETAS